jgi:hypothetical protein
VPVALADPIKPVKAPDASRYPKTPAVPPILYATPADAIVSIFPEGMGTPTPLKALKTDTDPRPITTPWLAVARTLAKLFTVAPPGSRFGAVDIKLETFIIGYSKVNFYL